jgi:hypothetical protein
MLSTFFPPEKCISVYVYDEGGDIITRSAVLRHSPDGQGFGSPFSPPAERIIKISAFDKFSAGFSSVLP